MWRKYVEPVLQWLYHVIREPRSELDRWQRAVRFAYDLGRYGARQLREDRAPQMAVALAYQALFALVPVLVVATMIARSVMGGQFKERVMLALTAVGLPETGEESMREWIEPLIDQAAGIQLHTAVQLFGFAIIAYAAINMLVTIENSFNIIYRAPGGRPWGRRIPLYWFLLTVGPLALVLTAVLNKQVEATLASLLGDAAFLAATGTTLWRICVGWLFWFAVYTLVPNTSVNLRSSAIGALVAVLLIEAGKSFLGFFVAKSFSLGVLTGSLGLIPVFMLWVHVMWLAILFGLELSATLQFLGDRAFEEMESRRESGGLIEPSIVVSAMQVVGEGFQSGRPASQRTIAQRLGVSEKLIAPIVQQLCREGYLHRVEGEDKSVCLSRPPDQIQAAELMDVGFRLADSSRESAVSVFANRLRDAQRERAANVALAAILLQQD